MKVANEETLPLGIVVERRALNNRWQRYGWRPVAVIAGAGPRDPKGEWLQLQEGEDWVQFHAGTLPLTLYPSDTEPYRVALSQSPPSLYVVLRPNEDPQVDHDVVPFQVSASPYEAQDYLDSGADIVEPVAMPQAVVAFVQDFVDRFHVDEPFVKRKRRKWAEQGGGISRRSSTPPGEEGA